MEWIVDVYHTDTAIDGDGFFFFFLTHTESQTEFGWWFSIVFRLNFVNISYLNDKLLIEKFLVIGSTYLSHSH